MRGFEKIELMKSPTIFETKGLVSSFSSLLPSAVLYSRSRTLFCPSFVLMTSPVLVFIISNTPQIPQISPSCLSSGVGQHELDAVFLIYSGSAGIIVYSNDVCVGIVLLDSSGHSLGNDVVWQTAKGLSADDVLNT